MASTNTYTIINEPQNKDDIIKFTKQVEHILVTSIMRQIKNTKPIKSN